MIALSTTLLKPSRLVAVALAVGVTLARADPLLAQADRDLDVSNEVPGTVFRDCPSCPEMIILRALVQGSGSAGGVAREGQRAGDRQTSRASSEPGEHLEAAVAERAAEDVRGGLGPQGRQGARSEDPGVARQDRGVNGRAGVFSAGVRALSRVERVRMIERGGPSLKYEAVYLHELRNGLDAERIIDSWIDLYDEVRPHSSLGGRTPMPLDEDETKPITVNYCPR